MKKKIIFWVACLSLLMIPMVLGSSIVPYEVPFEIDFDRADHSQFTISLPRNEYHFDWNDNESHSDESYVYQDYFTLDEEEYCDDTKRSADEYKNITSSIVRMLDTCSEITKNLSTSQDADHFELLYEQEFLKNEDYEDTLEFLETCEEEKDNVDRTVARLQQDSRDLVTCQDEKKVLEDSDSGFLFPFVIGGLAGAVGYNMYSKKKRNYAG